MKKILLGLGCLGLIGLLAGCGQSQAEKKTQRIRTSWR